MGNSGWSFEEQKQAWLANPGSFMPDSTCGRDFDDCGASGYSPPGYVVEYYREHPPTDPETMERLRKCNCI